MEETTVSTPTESSVEDTSANVELTADVNTSTVEPDTSDNVAETGTNEDEIATPTARNDVQERLYAGKYKTVEELEKGYDETQKYINKAAEFEKKYNDLLSAQETRKQQAQLHEAKQQGFNTVEEYNISNRVKLAEFEHYANGITQIAPEHYEIARENLLNYYNTGNTAYLAEAKKYFPIEFVENATTLKNRLSANLTAQMEQNNKKAQDERDEQLATAIRAEFAEFISDINENEGKGNALKMFCNANFINSIDDMKSFEGIYSSIAKYEREKAIKEYEASKTIEKTKDKAQIDAGAVNGILGNSVPTYEQIAKMSQKEFDKAVDKYGLDKILQAK